MDDSRRCAGRASDAQDVDPLVSSVVSRRSFFSHVGRGLCGAALLQILQNDLLGADVANRVYDSVPRPPHFTPRATSVIQLFMNGGPSQVDLFDPKSELTRRHGEAHFDRIAGDVENPTQAGALMRSPFRFRQHGESGSWVSEVLPHLAECVDDISVIRSMHTVNITHEPAIWKIQSGGMLPGLPTMGAWIAYGLGTENQNLPAYVVLDDPSGLPVNGTQNWQSGFLPPVYQGTRFRSTGDPVLNLRRQFEQPDEVRDLQLDLLGRLDAIHQRARPHDARLTARIASYELAARMQMSTTEALDLSQESAATLEMYGIGREPTDSYGRRCLYARRLVERGVRFVQIFIDGQIWDNHASIQSELASACARTDQPAAALLRDLKQRGLLDSTLVLWGGEMGRLPIAQIRDKQALEEAGRDHSKRAMCAWMAGGGVKAGYVHGQTDELGFEAIEDRVSVSEWHATVLHLLGLDHDQLSFHRNGLDERLTGVEPVEIVRGLLA